MAINIYGNWELIKPTSSFMLVLHVLFNHHTSKQSNQTILQHQESMHSHLQAYFVTKPCLVVKNITDIIFRMLNYCEGKFPLSPRRPLHYFDGCLLSSKEHLVWKISPRCKPVLDSLSVSCSTILSFNLLTRMFQNK